MSQPFIRMPEPEAPRPFKRRLQPDGARKLLQQGWREVRRQAENLSRRSQELWRRARRHPRTIGLVAGGLVFTLLGAYTLNASGIGRSACSSAQSKGAKPASFLLLMDSIASPVQGGELEINYDICGLAKGAAYRGRVEITQQRASRKGAGKQKPFVITFQDRVNGPAARRHRELELVRLKPGSYTMELSVTDKRGRERKTVQKIKLEGR